MSMLAHFVYTLYSYLLKRLNPPKSSGFVLLPLPFKSQNPQVESLEDFLFFFFALHAGVNADISEIIKIIRAPNSASTLFFSFLNPTFI
jgi:hypothetical protein